MSLSLLKHRLELDRRGGYEYEDLLACGRGEMFGPGNAQLPLPPMLMFDRITKIDASGLDTKIPLNVGYGGGTAGGQSGGFEIALANAQLGGAVHQELEAANRKMLEEMGLYRPPTRLRNRK